MIKNIPNYLADSVMQYVVALINSHQAHRFELEIYQRISFLVEQKLNKISASDSTRNK